MNHINKIYRQADVYYKLSLLKTGIGPEGPTPQEKAILKQYDSGWTSSAKTLEEFETGFNIFIKFTEIISNVPTPVGNPFAIALAGDCLAKGDWVGAASNIYCGLPLLSSIGKSLSLFKLNKKYISQLLINVPKWTRPLVKKMLIWLARSASSVEMLQIQSLTLIQAVRNIINKMEDKVLIGFARTIANKTAFTTKSVSKNPNDESFNQTDAVYYIADFLYSTFLKEVKDLGSIIMEQTSAVPD